MKKDIETYKNELMKLYSRGNACSEASDRQSVENIPEASHKKAEKGTAETDLSSEMQDDPTKNDESCTEKVTDGDEKENQDDEKGEHSTAYLPQEGDASETDCPRDANDPDIPDIAQLSEPSVIQQESLGDQTGIIIVNVRTGHDASPIVGASVTVSAVLNGQRLLIASGTTDISGCLRIADVPAPDKELSLHPDSTARPYSLFDITVTAPGYFRARSVDVPVFPGITSVQDMNLIPLPLGAEKDDETLTFFNQEPN